LLDTVERCGLKEKTTVVVTTDHGFKRVSKLIRPNVILQREGLLQTRGTAITQWHAYTMAQGGIAFVYIRDPDGKRERLAQIKELFSKTEGISRVFTGEEAPALGMPTPGENNGMGDLILYAKAGYAFRHDVQPDEIISASGAYNGSHGYLSSDPDLDGICIFSGNKIRRGVQMDRMENRDVAPTLARILGLELPQAEGRILEEILLPEP
jgi:predicted AlkP superfamily pyrophosphatase or phosphodiesterase